MNGFIARIDNLQRDNREESRLRFQYYLEEAPLTVKAFRDHLPFSLELLHARFSGNEIWSPTAPALDVIQENATIYTRPGEVVIGPISPKRVKTAGCMGIYYGEGKGLDACNVFARIVDEDAELLRQVGEEIWREGGRTIRFSEYL